MRVAAAAAGAAHCRTVALSLLLPVLQVPLHAWGASVGTGRDVRGRPWRRPVVRGPGLMRSGTSGTVLVVTALLLLGAGPC